MSDRSKVMNNTECNCWSAGFSLFARVSSGAEFSPSDIPHSALRIPQSLL